MRLTPTEARKLGSELLKVAEREQNAKTRMRHPDEAKKAPAKAKAPKDDATLCPRCQTTPTIEHDGRQWCSHCGAFITGRTAYPPPRAKTQKPLKKQKVVDLISK